jgi:YVTN family beta-propeller protein
VIVPAGPFHGVHGLAFGPDGALYAGDIMGATLHRVEVATGSHQAAVPAPLGLADDVAFAPAGTPYAGTMVWTGVAVGKLYAQAPGGKPRVLADNLPSINTVGFAPDGRLYATQIGRDKTLWSVELSGQTPPKKLWDETGGLNGFVIAEDGYLYGPQADLGRVIRLDLETLEIEPIATGFDWPTAVEMDARGLLYVLDFNGGTVTQLNRDTGEHTVLARLESGLDNMAMGPPQSPYANKLYVSSIGANGIYEIDLVTGVLRTVVAGQLTAPGGVTVLGAGPETRVYIADMFSLRAVTPATGQVSYVLPVHGQGGYPATVSHGRLGGRDVLITGSWFTGSVQIIDPMGGAVLRTETGFAVPYDVALLDGSLLVAEAGAGQVTLVDGDGDRQALAAGFEFPAGLALAGEQTVYVTDAGAGTVSAVDTQTRDVRAVANSLQRPEGIAVLPDHTLAVVDSAAQAVYRLDPVTGKQSVILANASVGLMAPEPRPATWIFNGLAAAANGTLYLPSDVNASLMALSTVEPAKQAEDFARFLSWWSGDYDNLAQVRAQESAGMPVEARNRPTLLHIRKVDLPAFGPEVYYAEWRAATEPGTITRQRIYAFEIDPAAGRLRLNLHIWPLGDADFRERTAGAYLEPSKLDGVTPADMTGLTGCDVFFRDTGELFAGAMEKGGCAFEAPDGTPVYSWSQMTLSPTQFGYLDGWFHRDGRLFRRFTKEWYVFDKR